MGAIEKRTRFFSLRIPLTGRMLALLEGRDDAGVDWQAQEKLILEGLSKGSGSWSSWDDGAWARIGCILLCKGVSIMTVLRRPCTLR